MVSNELVMKLLHLASQVLPADEIISPDSAPTFRPPQKALIVPSKFIGDSLLLTPFIASLRANLPRPVQLDILATPATRQLFEAMPELDAVYQEQSGPLKRPKIFLQDQGYDTLFFCRYSLYWGNAAKQARIAQRIGYDLSRWGIDSLPRWGKCLTHTVPSHSILDTRHQVQLYLDMLQQLGMSVTAVIPPFCPIEPQHIEQAAAWVQQAGGHPRILIHAAAGSPGKRWNRKNWVQLVKLLDKILSPVIFTVGSTKETLHYAHWQPQNGLVNLCGKTTLLESMALLSMMDLVITLDTSIAHLAAMAGTPRLLVLYGPTNEKQWRPMVQPNTVLKQLYLELPCRPCIVRTCEHKSCMRKMSPKQVLEAAMDCFQQKPLVPHVP